MTWTPDVHYRVRLLLSRIAQSAFCISSRPSSAARRSRSRPRHPSLSVTITNCLSSIIYFAVLGAYTLVAHGSTGVPRCMRMSTSIHPHSVVVQTSTRLTVTEVEAELLAGDLMFLLVRLRVVRLLSISPVRGGVCTV